MACQCGVVCLDVELEVLIESVLAEEAYRSGCIEKSYWCFIGSFGLGSI